MIERIDTPPLTPPLTGEGNNTLSPERGELERGLSEKQALFELQLEEKYKDYKKIVEFREMILELNSELGLYGISRLFQKLLDKI